MMFEPADEGATGIALTAPMPAAETARNAAANKVFIGVSFLKSSFAVRFALEPGDGREAEVIRRQAPAAESILPIIDTR
jgi:hypothetical protein